MPQPPPEWFAALFLAQTGLPDYAHCCLKRCLPHGPRFPQSEEHLVGYGETISSALQAAPDA